MKISGTKTLPVSRQSTWSALFDNELIRDSIAGCETLEWVNENELEGKITLKFGAIKAKFNILLTISDIVDLVSYAVTIKSKAGVLGFANGTAKVQLEDDDAGCAMSYDAEIKTGGKIAQLGSRLMNSVAKKRIDSFFDAFVEGIKSKAGS